MAIDRMTPHTEVFKTDWHLSVRDWYRSLHLNLIDWIDGTCCWGSIYCSWIVLNEWELEAGVCVWCIAVGLCAFPYLPRPSLRSLSLRYRVCDSVYSTLTNIMPKGTQSVFVCNWNWCLRICNLCSCLWSCYALPSGDFVPCVFNCCPCHFACGLPCVFYPS